VRSSPHRLSAGMPRVAVASMVAVRITKPPAPPRLAHCQARPLELPPMGLAVKRHSPTTPSALGLAAGVRIVRIAGSTTQGGEGRAQPVLHTHHIAHHQAIPTSQMAQPPELAAPFVDPGPQRPDTKLLCQPECVPLVALRTPALAHARDHQLLDVRLEHLVQPPRQRPLLQAHVPVPSDPAQHLDQSPRVRLHHVRAQTLAAGSDDPQRAACRVGVHADIPVHGRSPPRWVGLLLALRKAHPLPDENASSSSGCSCADRGR
jgi:hypothetical protein